MAEVNRHTGEQPDDRHEHDDPLHPEVVRWLHAYATASGADRDAVVAQILDVLNARLPRATGGCAERLVEYETRLRVLTEQMPAILWSTDREMRVTSLTGAGMAAVGLDPSASRHRPLTEIIGTADAASLPIAAHRQALLGEPSVYEYEWRGRAYLVHVEPLRNREGAIVGTIGAALDITERKQAETALRQSDERFRVALRGSPIIVFSQDTALRHTWIYNPSPGFSPEEILGKTDAEIHAPTAAATLTAIKRRVLATGVGTRQEVQLTIRGRAGYFDLSIEPLRNAAGAVVGIIGAATDITERKLVEEQRAIERERQARLDGLLFAARQLSHRLNNDLSRSVGAIERIQPRTDLPPRPRAWADEAAAGLDAAMERLKEFQTLLHGEAGDHPSS